MLTRGAKGRYEEEIGRRSGERQKLVAELQRLKEQQGLGEKHHQQQQDLLVDMQLEHARTNAELEALRRAVQECIGASMGKEVAAVKRSREKLEAAKKRGRQNREAATDARKQQQSAEQQLGALKKTTEKLSASLTNKAAAANEALKVKTAELEQEQDRARALEEQLEAAATQRLTLEQQQQQKEQLRERYRQMSAATVLQAATLLSSWQRLRSSSGVQASAQGLRATGQLMRLKKLHSGGNKTQELCVCG